MYTLRFDGPGRYEVITQDGGASDVSEIFEGVEVRTAFSEGRELVYYTLNVKDQSELIGFLNSLYGCRYTILRVVYDPEQEPSGTII